MLCATTIDLAAPVSARIASIFAAAWSAKQLDRRERRPVAQRVDRGDTARCEPAHERMPDAGIAEHAVQEQHRRARRRGRRVRREQRDRSIIRGALPAIVTNSCQNSRSAPRAPEAHVRRALGAEQPREREPERHERAAARPGRPAAAPATNGQGLAPSATLDAARLRRARDRAVRERERDRGPRAADPAGGGSPARRAASSGGRERLAEAVQLLHRLERLLEQASEVVQDHADHALLPARVERDLLVEPALEPRRDRAGGFAPCRSGTASGSRAGSSDAAACRRARGLAISTPIFANARFASSPEALDRALHELEGTRRRGAPRRARCSS